MKKDRIEEERKVLDKTRQEREEERNIDARKRENEKRKRKMEIDSAIHINLISVAEMKVHTTKMRAEMDGKFVECLMATGVTRAEALKCVRGWNAEGGYGYNGY